MEAVGEIAAAGDSKCVGRRSAGIGKIARPGIAGVEGQRLTAVPRNLHGAAVVVALRVLVTLWMMLQQG